MSVDDKVGNKMKQYKEKGKEMKKHLPQFEKMMSDVWILGRGHKLLTFTFQDHKESGGEKLVSRSVIWKKRYYVFDICSCPPI